MIEISNTVILKTDILIAVKNLFMCAFNFVAFRLVSILIILKFNVYFHNKWFLSLKSNCENI